MSLKPQKTVMKPHKTVTIADPPVSNNDENKINNNHQNVIHLESFIYRGKKIRAIVNTCSIQIEYESSPNIRTIIPLEEVVNAWPCFCTKPNKRNLICECIKDAGPHHDDNDSQNDENSHSSSSRENLKITLIRLYHAIPVGKHAWKLELIPFEPNSSSEESLYEWINSIRGLIEGLNRPRKLMVFVNPIGGKRKATTIYRKKVDPLLKIAGIDAQCIVTERPNHAKEYIQHSNFCLKLYDGIICVGGDGMFSEILNGLLIRTQKEAGINWNTIQGKLETPSIPIAVIPAGSTDAVVYGTTGVNDPVTSTIHIILGKKLNIDVCAIHHRDEERLVRYATSFLGYGYFGDTIADSERNRWMGPRRYDWAGFKKFLGHRIYNGEIKFCISPSDGSPKDKTFCTANCIKCKYAVKNKNIKDESDVCCMSIRGRFLAINVATLSCKCGMSKQGISPAAHVGDGCADLILVSQCSRLNYLKYLLQLGFSNQNRLSDYGFVDAYRVREFEFTPIIYPKGSSKKYQVSTPSVWNCDGEVVNVPAVHVKIHCQLITIFASGIEVREKK